MAKLIAAFATLCVIVLFTLSTGSAESADTNELRLVLALPTASGGAQQLALDAAPGESIQMTNLASEQSPAELPADAYRIHGTWTSKDTLELDVFVAETVSFRDNETTWAPERELRHHRLSVQRSHGNGIGELQPAPGGVPQALLMSAAAGNAVANRQRTL